VQIDTIRGLACVLLVAYHVVGSEPSNGLLLADGPYRLAADLLAYIRMPLFTFLSGYVYAWRPFNGYIHSFLRGKVRRLLIPMVVVGSVFVFARVVTPGTHVSTDDSTGVGPSVEDTVALCGSPEWGQPALCKSFRVSGKLLFDQRRLLPLALFLGRGGGFSL
jgi:fucose 4-O-acetylase-like acetyltransferase